MDFSKICRKMNTNIKTYDVCGICLFFIVLGLFITFNNKFSTQEPISEFPSAYENSKKIQPPSSSVKTSSSSLNIDLLPKNNTNELIKTSAGTSLKDLIGQNSLRDTRNANLQLRSDPPITMMETGPFNISTITQNNKSSGLDLCSK